MLHVLILKCKLFHVSVEIALGLIGGLTGLAILAITGILVVTCIYLYFW